MQEIEFFFINEDGELEFELHNTTHMAAEFNCFSCGDKLKFKKIYDPVPMHYETLLNKCSDVMCKNCGSRYSHVQLEGYEYASLQRFEDPDQLKLF